jgi:hypothetical protein
MGMEEDTRASRESLVPSRESTLMHLLSGLATRVSRLSKIKQIPRPNPDKQHHDSNEGQKSWI